MKRYPRGRITVLFPSTIFAVSSEKHLTLFSRISFWYPLPGSFENTFSTLGLRTSFVKVWNFFIIYLCFGGDECTLPTNNQQLSTNQTRWGKRTPPQPSTSQDTSFGSQLVPGTSFVVPGGAVVHLISILTSAALITTLPAYSAYGGETGWDGKGGSWSATPPFHFFRKKGMHSGPFLGLGDGVSLEIKEWWRKDCLCNVFAYLLYFPIHLSPHGRFLRISLRNTQAAQTALPATPSNGDRKVWLLRQLSC